MLKSQCYVLLRRRYDVPIRCRRDAPLRSLGDVPSRRHWVFHLTRTYDVAGTYRETSLRRRHDILMPGGEAKKKKGSDISCLKDSVNFCEEIKESESLEVLRRKLKLGKPNGC